MDGIADAVISVRGLRKSYGAVQAVAGIDLEVRRGEIFAFLGPNGAGKTTTVEILEGFRRRSDGDVNVLGVDPAGADAAWRNRVGAVLQESEPEPGLTVRECLQLYAGYYERPRDIGETIAQPPSLLVTSVALAIRAVPSRALRRDATSRPS